jgi:RNA polymerase sigma-70 factor (ECF subfamily)
MTIWESGQKLLEVKDIDSYLYIITRNRAYYYLNKNNPTHSVSVEDIPFESLFHTETPEELSITNEFRQKIDEAINDLPERCREIFLLAREEGLKYKEIASKLSLSEKTVNAQMVTAIKRIGNALRQFITFLF